MNTADTYLEEFKNLIKNVDGYEDIVNGKFPSVSEMLSMILSKFAAEFDVYLELFIFCVAVVLFSALVREVDEKITVPVGIAASAVVVVSIMRSGLISDETFFGGVTEISNFVKAFVPIFAVVTALSGDITLSGVYGGVALFCLEIFSKMNVEILMPVIHLLISVGVISGLSGGERTGNVSAAIKKMFIACQCALSSLMLTVLSLNGFAAHGTDTLMFKTGKMLTGAAVPVIGSTISGSYETLAACFEAASGIIGAGGMFVIFITVAPYVIRICLFILVMAGSEILSGFLSCKNTERVFAAFKNAGILVISSYAFEIIVLVAGISIMMVVGKV